MVPLAPSTSAAPISHYNPRPPPPCPVVALPNSPAHAPSPAPAPLPAPDSDRVGTVPPSPKRARKFETPTKDIEVHDRPYPPYCEVVYINKRLHCATVQTPNSAYYELARYLTQEEKNIYQKPKPGMALVYIPSRSKYVTAYQPSGYDSHLHVQCRTYDEKKNGTGTTFETVTDSRIKFPYPHFEINIWELEILNIEYLNVSFLSLSRSISPPLYRSLSLSLSLYIYI